MSDENGDWIGNKHCIGSEVEGKKDCKSSDALGCYEHLDDDGNVWYDGYCRSCNQVFSKSEVHGSSLAAELGVDSESGEVTERVHFEKQPKKEPITVKEAKEFIDETGYVSNNYRGIRDDISEFFGHLTKLDDNNKVKARYYPETLKGKIQGYKCRNHPKNFRYGNKGSTGTTNDLSGMSKFRGGGRTVLVVGGEEDKAAAYQMLLDYYSSKGQKHFVPAVVSPTTGEGSAPNQLKRNYEYLDQFENIILGLDHDEAGIEATKNCAKVLPKGKVKIATWSGGDPNAMLQKKQAKLFISNYFEAKDLVSSGIIRSGEVMDYIKEELIKPRITLPPYMKILQENTRGGILQGRIINLIGDTSTGKSTHVNGMEYHWIFNSPVKTGVVSLEATAGQYGLDVLSLHLEKNLAWESDGGKILEYLETDEVKEQYKTLWKNEYGEDRFCILDERDGDIKALERQMDALVKKHGCMLIIIDVASDVLRGLSLDEQAEHMKFQKNIIKTGVTIINVLHTRKPPSSRDGLPQKASEYDALGSGSMVQSGAINIVINRNKMSKCSIERNTTYVDMPKCRGGTTGAAGQWFYDVETRKVYDRNEYFEEHPDKLPEGYDLNISSYDKEWYKEGGNCDLYDVKPKPTIKKVVPKRA